MPRVAAPGDKPYLLSSIDELALSDAGLRKWRTKLCRGYPGPASSYAAKLSWAKTIQDNVDLEARIMDDTYPHEEGTVVGMVLNDSCPAAVTVQLMVKRCQATRLHFDEESATKFLSTAPCARRSLPISAPDSGARAFVHRGGYNAAALFNRCTTNVQRVGKYLQWLSTNPATGSDIHPSLCPESGTVPDFSRNPKLGDELVCIASVTGVAKCEKLQNVSTEALQKLGLRMGTEGVEMAFPNRDDYYSRGPCLQLRETIGELFFFPGRHGAYCVALELEVACPGFDGRGSLPSAALDQLEAKQALAPHRSYQIVDGVNTVWLSAYWREERERVEGHIRWGDGESESIKKRLDKGNTDTGNLKLMMLEREFNAVKRNLRYTECGTRQTNAQKLCTILALAMVFANEPFWMHDNEDPEAVAAVLKDLAIYLRTNLLKLSDAELELGADQSEAEGSAARAALYVLLDSIKARFEQESYRGRYKIIFNYKPGKPKSEEWKRKHRELAAERKRQRVLAGVAGNG